MILPELIFVGFLLVAVVGAVVMAMLWGVGSVVWSALADLWAKTPLATQKLKKRRAAKHLRLPIVFRSAASFDGARSRCGPEPEPAGSDVVPIVRQGRADNRAVV